MKKAKEILKNLNLRPTSQRLAITERLIKKKEVHVTAYSLEKMLVKSKVYISRATIYNNLNELSSKGFVKKLNQLILSLILKNIRIVLNY